jgi:hypothetical protein
MTTLSNEEKISIIDQHIKNIEYNKYNLEISLIEENAVANPEATTISSLNSQIAVLNSKISVLQTEKAELTV